MKKIVTISKITLIIAISLITSMQLTALQTATQAGRRGLTQFGRYGRGLTSVRPTTLPSMREYIAPTRMELMTGNWRKELADVAYLYSHYGTEGIEALPFERLKYLNELLSVQNPEGGLTKVIQQAYDKAQAQMVQPEEIAELIGVSEYPEISPEVKAAIISRLPIPQERALTTYKPAGLSEILTFEKPKEEVAEEILPSHPVPELGYGAALGYLTLGLLTSAVIEYIKETYDDTPQAERKIAGLEQLQQYPDLHQTLIDYILTQLNIPPADFAGKTPEEIVRLISEKSQYLGTNFFELYSQLVEQWFNKYIATARTLYQIPQELTDKQIIAQGLADKAYKTLNEVVFKPLAMLSPLPNEAEKIYLVDWLYWTWINSSANIVDFVSMQQNSPELAKKINAWKNSLKTRAQYNAYYYWYGPQTANDWLDNQIAIQFPDSQEAILQNASRLYTLGFGEQEI